MSPADIVILILVGGFLLWMVGRSLWRRRRGGNPGCGGCPYAGHCAGENRPDKTGCRREPTDEQ